MPEAGEVLTTVDMMNFYMINKKISNINFLSGKHYEDNPENYDLLLESLPLKVDTVYCKGKLIVMRLSNPNDESKKWWILNHLVMTGSWRLKCNEEHESYVRCRIEFEKCDANGTFDIDSLDFVDIRDLGKFDFINEIDEVTSRLSNLADGFIGDFIINYKIE